MAGVKHRAPLFALLGLAVLLCAVAGLCLGSSAISPAALCRALFQGDTGTPAYSILVHVRLPRVLGGLLAGGALAVAGAVLQGVLQNPMAGPSVMGVNGGAGLCVLLASALLPPSRLLLPLAAFTGALAAAALVLGISAATRMSRLTLLLAGFAVGSICNAGMNCVLLLFPDAYVGAAGFLAGGLSGVTLRELGWPAAYIAAGLCVSLAGAWGLNLLELGEDTAASLGVRVPLRRMACVAGAAALAGAAVSFAGMVGFVGLMVPHGARLLLGGDNTLVLPASALGGAGLVVLCDLAARLLFAPYELPVGILLSLIGGPFFIALILRERGRLA